MNLIDNQYLVTLQATYLCKLPVDAWIRDQRSEIRDQIKLEAKAKDKQQQRQKQILRLPDPASKLAGTRCGEG